MTMINDIAAVRTRGLVVDERFARPEVEKLTGWKLLLTWIGMIALGWGIVGGIAYGLWQLFLTIA